MIQIVPMDQTHVEAVAALEKQCFADPWSLQSIAGELTNPLALWLVAVTDAGTVAGYAGSQFVLDEADVMNVAVSPAERRSGTGSQLMLALMRELAGRGIRILTLEVRTSNTAAVSMYDRLGFKQVGRRTRYYFHPVEDALILRAELLETQGGAFFEYTGH